MNKIKLSFIVFSFLAITINAQTVEDDFEGSGTITTWYGDNCGIDLNFSNPYKTGINTSNTVLQYNDTGATFANVGFDTSPNFNLNTKNAFKLKIYVPSSGLVGAQTNKVSLKLQDGTITEPWTTQSEIIKPIVLDTWQELIFDFENDPYININSGSLAPLERTDFNRVVIQVNGEGNTAKVVAYIDDVLHFNVEDQPSEFDTLVWSDEFDGSGPINTTKWFQQTKLIAGDSWANNEVQHYTDRQVNSFRDNGSLKIKAIKETYSDQGVQKEYTSARLNSTYAFRYGRVEVRAKLPSVAGTWPAIWLLGKNIDEDGTYWDNIGYGSAPWPFCGEIDIMEPDIAKTEILGTWHWNNGGGYTYNSASVPMSNTEASQNFHDYILEWDETEMRIYLDNILVNSMPTVDPFNQEFFILLNVAMGGNLGGPIDSGFSQDEMEIDYVRVYKRSSLSTKKSKTTNIRVYPNPVQNELYIDLRESNNIHVHFQVLDISSRIIFEDNHLTNGGKITYNTASLKSGLYFMKVYQNNEISNTFKFIKK